MTAPTKAELEQLATTAANAAGAIPLLLGDLFEERDEARAEVERLKQALADATRAYGKAASEEAVRFAESISDLCAKARRAAVEEAAGVAGDIGMATANERAQATAGEIAAAIRALAPEPAKPARCPCCNALDRREKWIPNCPDAFHAEPAKPAEPDPDLERVRAKLRALGAPVAPKPLNPEAIERICTAVSDRHPSDCAMWRSGSPCSCGIDEALRLLGAGAPAVPSSSEPPVPVIAAVRVRVYPVLERAVEDGVAMGWLRAHKHTPTPGAEDAKDAIAQEVLNHLCEALEFDREADGG